jgi:hypothetical protein
MWIVPVEQATKIFRFSFLTFVPIFTSLYYEKYDIMMMPLTVFITSISYWKEPIYGWRRNIDILAVVVGSGYQLLYFPICSHKVYCFTSMIMGTGCYVLSWFFHKKNINWSCNFHCGTHIFANLTLLLLITGL